MYCATCTRTRNVAVACRTYRPVWHHPPRQRSPTSHNINASSVVISVSRSLPHRVRPVLIINPLAPWTLFWASLLVYLRITSMKQILGRLQLQNKSWTRLCAGRLRNTRPTPHRDTQQGQVRTLTRIGRSY